MAIGYEATEWKDGAQGGTPIDAAALNKMENGISEACAAVDLLNEEGNVTTEDIASKAVTTEKIADGAVGLDQLSEELRDSVSQAPLIQAGAVGIYARGIAGNQTWTHRVTFEKPYDVAPTIAMNAVESWFTATATDVATDGFTYVIRNLDSTTRPSATIRSTWVAIGPAA